MIALAKPKGAIWQHATLKKIWAMDEVPTLGSGVRHVWVLEKKKFVKMAGAFGAKATIPINVYHRILCS